MKKQNTRFFFSEIYPCINGLEYFYYPNANLAHTWIGSSVCGNKFLNIANFSSLTKLFLLLCSNYVNLIINQHFTENI